MTQKNSISQSLARASFTALSAVGPAVRRLASRSSVQATGKFLKQQLWIWPILAAIILAVTGLLVEHSVDKAMSKQREAELNTILNADVEALKIWMNDQGQTAELVARDEKLQAMIGQLMESNTGGVEGERSLIYSKTQAELRERLKPILSSLGYIGYFIVAENGVTLAAEQDAPIGKVMTGYRKEFFDRVLKTGPSVCKPYRSPLLLQDESSEYRANLPTMLAAAPVKISGGKVSTVIALRIRPDQEFSQILRVAQAGQTGETYAFDKDGLLLSNSRFDTDLKRIGLLADLPESQSILTLKLRNPGVNMMKGERPEQLRSEQPLPFNVAEAIQGKSGCEPWEYRDYRGVPVVGAWTWLTEYDFGVCTEMDVEEAYAPVYILRRAFWGLMILLGIASVAIFVAMLLMAKQQKMLQAAVLEAKQLGQYALEEKLGSGGMGTVYKARHAMLRRPTALKLLDVDKISPNSIARFEREVQITATLTHPNTVSIFDYGRTPEGIFYYAMEYLEGINLDDLITRHGAISEARMVYIMKQVCGSMGEAHAAGLVHRDIKPANIFLTQRGGLHDFVKVLDFGLVKAITDAEQAHLTSTNAVTGTPHYLSPEGVSQPDQVDVRSDVYALGAVMYFLLTGSTVFSGQSVVEICMKHVREQPETPSTRSNRAISPQLEAVILRCLAKSQTERPATASEVLNELMQCKITGSWTESDAATWWKNRHDQKQQETQVFTAELHEAAMTTARSEANATMEKTQL